MTNALAGRTIVITRPATQTEALCGAIEQAGGTVLRFPLLEIVPVPYNLPRLDEFDIVFFVSPNAVEHGLPKLLPSWPQGLRVAAVGQGSARALRAHGFSDILVPEAGFDSEAVLALPVFAPEAVRGRSVLIVRGDGGRELLGETLTARGARVQYLCVYHRRFLERDPAPLLTHKLDALSVTSSESVDHLARVLGTDLSRLSSVPVFAPHSRIAARCRSHGMIRIVTIETGDKALLCALLSFFG